MQGTEARRAAAGGWYAARISSDPGPEHDELHYDSTSLQLPLMPSVRLTHSCQMGRRERRSKNEKREAGETEQWDSSIGWRYILPVKAAKEFTG